MKQQATHLLSLIFFIFYPAHALPVDTIISGNGSPGPYPFSTRFVDTSSIRVFFQDSMRGEVPPFIFIEQSNGLLFSEPIDSGIGLHIRYDTDFSGLRKTYALYKPYILDIQDTSLNKLSIPDDHDSRASQEDITVTGYKSIGISAGNQGQLNMEQALEVRISGKIRDNTELSANLSDQGTSLEGDTREIGEIDRMFVALDNPRYAIVAGDQYISLPAGGLIDGNKKIKGLSALYRNDRMRAKIFGAISGGKYTVQTVTGRLGFQGPYYLTGNNEADLISPVRGTVSVIFDGIKLSEGEKHDYTVDYELGTIVFMPTTPVIDNSVIQISYEYKAFDYQRTFAGADCGALLFDSSLRINGALWFESDNKEHPIDLDLSRETVSAMKLSGDTPPRALNGRKIHPNDVSSYDALYRLYKLDSASTGSNMIYFYTYAPFNSAAPKDNAGYYNVWFTRTAEGAGEYVQFSENIDSSVITALDPALVDILQKTLLKNDPRGPAFVYAGHGRGNYSALSPVPAPRRTTKGIVNASFTPEKWFALSTEIAGEEEDKNLFSNKDDKNNTASASRSRLILGSPAMDKRSFWFLGDHRFASTRFSREILSAYEARTTWDIVDRALPGNALHVWHGDAGATVVPGLSIDGTYGQFISNDSILAHRFGWGTRAALRDHAHLEYRGMLLKNGENREAGQVTRDSLNALFKFDKIEYGLHADDEWRKNRFDLNRGKIGGGMTALFKPFSLSEMVYCAQERKGGRSIFLPQESSSRDTGLSFLWDQSLRKSLIQGWTVSATSSYQFRKNTLRASDNRRSVLLITASNDISSVRTGFNTHQDYRLSSEQASAYIQVPVFVGKGQGTHAFDSSKNEYLPVPYGGDYIVSEQETFTASNPENIRKSQLTGSWFFKPQNKKIRGILADLSWRGSFGVEEHIRLDSALVARNKFPAATRIPGYSSISRRYDSLVNYADVFYRQDVDWRPSFTEGFHGSLYVRPYLRNVRFLDENGFEAGTRFEKKWRRVELSLAGNLHSLARDELYSGTAVNLRDRHLVLEQQVNLTKQVSLFIHETAGAAEKNSAHGPYVQLKPGASLRIENRGWAEVSYTWSFVDIPVPTEYPMALGFDRGTSHLISSIIDISAGDHFSISGSYQGNFNKQLNEKWLHVVSMEVKAYL